MNALNSNSTAMQSNVLGVQNISVLNQEQKRQKAEIAQADLTAESNNKKSKGADQKENNTDQKSKISAERVQDSKQKSLERTTDVATKSKSEESRALVRFESMMQQQKTMEDHQATKAESDDAVLANQQKAFDARSAYGVVTNSASAKNVQSIAKIQQDYNVKASEKSMTGELQVEKFIAPVPITSIKAPIAPSDHIYVITEATQQAAENIMDQKKDSETTIELNQKTDANTVPLSSVSMNGRGSEAQLESPPEGAKSSHNTNAPELSYGLAS